VSVNEKIRLIRETKGFTQEQVAEKLGVSPSAYGDIERGENDPKLSKLAKIAEIFEMSLADLVDLGEKGILNINFNNRGKQCTLIFGSSVTDKEMELKDKELALKDKEIELKNEKINDLNRIIALLENPKT
jgi:transcriptional regulator with XRE-family HTH domain